jgi:nickel transport protein
MLKKAGFSLLILLAIVGSPLKSLAHSIETNYLLLSEPGNSSRNNLDDLDTKVGGTQKGLELQSTYSSGESVQYAQVEVYAPNNLSEPWMVGTTDDQGRFNFIPDPSLTGDWEIAILQDGHEDYLTIPVQDNGIEFDLISQGDKKDHHYAFIPFTFWTVFGATTMGATAVWSWRKMRSLKNS